MSKPVAILDLSQIQQYLSTIDLIPLIEQGFVALSKDQAVVPPVGELLFSDPPGDTHIKYGYIKNQAYFTVKIASGFYENPQLGIKSSQGVILLFSQKTGQLLAILLDEGYLTDVRTAIASMITLKYLAPTKIHQIGIIGAGIQAKLQLRFLSQVTDCQEVMLWNRSRENAHAYQKIFENSAFKITIAESPAALTARCNVIITTTPATTSILDLADIRPGTHLTALGSDTAEKRELDPLIIQQADIVVADSLAQSHTRGEVFQARKAGTLRDEKLIELGQLIQQPTLGRTQDHQLTVADLTGVAVQDIMIATAVYEAMGEK